MKPIQFLGRPICSSTPKTTMKAMKPPVYQPYTLFSCDLNARLAEALVPSACPKPIPVAMSFLLGHAVFAVELVHVARVVPDDQHVDDQRPLGTDPEAE